MRPANIDKGLDSVVRPRICVGHTVKGGIDSGSDPLTTFAATVDMTTTKMMCAITAADGYISFSFDISQFHQTTVIPASSKPIITTQPRGFEEPGPNGEPASEMFWRLKVQMQGTRSASATANAQLDALLFSGGFRRAAGDSRYFTLDHPDHGHVRLAMLSDDGNGAAEKQAGIDHTIELVKRVYKISKLTPWTFMRGFEVHHDRSARTVTMTAKQLIKSGIDDLMPDEVRFKPLGPAPSWLSDTDRLLDPILTDTNPGYTAWHDRKQWFAKAVGWAIHVANAHVLAMYTLSVLCGVAKSPSIDAIKALKHLLCWMDYNQDKGIQWGPTDKAGIEALVSPPLDTIERMINTQHGPLPKCLIIFIDADLAVRSRYCVIAFLNGAPIYHQSRLQHSGSSDITDAESFAYSVGAIMAEVIRGRLEDSGYAILTELATVIATDNDATLRIASDAASAKRAMHILRRMVHTRGITDKGWIKAIKVKRDLNYADSGTHYLTKSAAAYFGCALRGNR